MSEWIFNVDTNGNYWITPRNNPGNSYKVYSEYVGVWKCFSCKSFDCDHVTIVKTHIAKISWCTIL